MKKQRGLRDVKHDPKHLPPRNRSARARGKRRLRYNSLYASDRAYLEWESCGRCDNRIRCYMEGKVCA